jgi:hypothetical protein
MSTTNKEGLIYTRVSSLKQVTQGSGLDSQYSACLKYAKDKNIKVINTLRCCYVWQNYLIDLDLMK